MRTMAIRLSKRTVVIQHPSLISHTWKLVTKVSVGGSLSCLSFVQAQLICHTLDIVLLMSNAVIMPPSALDRLASLHIEYPMLFELHNDAAQRISHSGVLEFVAEEGMIIMPYWMMQNMLLQEGDTVRVKNATLPKGTYVKLQPHTTDFLDISNPKAILEKTLRNFSCLTTGDSIMVAYNNKQYYIDIVETKPASAVSIIETDCEVDFAPPLDYKEPEKPQQPTVPASKATAEGGDTVVEDEPKFKPFTGSRKRLDGKASKLQASEVSSSARPVPSDSNKRSNQQTSAPGTSGASNSTRQKTGKLVFGSSASNNKEPQKAPAKEEEPPKKDEPKFQAFSGKSYSLKR
ncbi:ubiquitin recognition factor in ER-associated degradation protein 1-like isoform X1 [Panicum virgatum]|uniref:ubiquitin recognition factor in ER-associated degradation protein 1-like isoform X1 n=1 Tax=Panicum virgatum TaxID=38727 RepID=UPI0019D5916F|nr:ubiquitin recognition factor in ER-associated degradation protein 1-like isoform X1 [Panicum virgatum]